MTTTDHSPVLSGGMANSFVRSMTRGALYGAALAPVSAAALAAVLTGHSESGATWLGRWQRNLLGAAAPDRAPRAWATGAKAVIGLILGVLAVVPVLIEVLFVARGVLYGIVDRGPYDTSWGGPTMIGAWITHFLVAVPFAVVALFLLRGIAALHLGWTRRLDGRRGGRWVTPVTVLAFGAAAILVVAWSHQL